MGFVLFLICILHPSPADVVAMSVSAESVIVPEQPRANSIAYIRKSGNSNYSIRAENRSSCRFQAPTIPCECLLAVSDSYFMEENGVRVSKFSVGLPDIHVTVPARHELQQRLDVTVRSKLCVAETFSVELLYREFEVLPSSEWRIVVVSSVVLHTSHVNVSFPCENFVHSGFYRVRVVSLHGYDIQTDKLILVNETTRFALQLRNDSIFPHCVKDFSLQWKTANCEAAALNYRIRVLAVQEGDETHEHRSHYIEDIALSTEEKTVKIGCFLFDIFYKKYCFELMSIEAVSGAYHLWRRSCVNTEPTSRAEAKWTRWSSWSECTSTCGESVQKRHRYCENSKLNQGAPCEGDVLETRPCPSSGIKCTDVTPSFTNLGNCTCGCEMTGTSGIFFATAADSELCSGNQTWSMTARSEHLVSDFKIIADVGAPGKLFFFVGAPYEELVWFSGSSQEQDFTLSIDRPIFIVLWHKGNRSILEHRKGFSIAYSTREVLPQFPVSTAASVCQPLCPETLFIGTLAIMFILIIFVPPFVCASIIQRLRRHTVQELSLSGKLHDEEMVRSGNTDCTQVSGVKPPCLAQRSIGVQLSVQSTPRLPRSRLPNEPPLARGTSSMSTSDELEYDYYDGSTIPGSLLAPLPNHMLSEIDIDQIIAQSLLFSGGGDGDETRDV